MCVLCGLFFYFRERRRGKWDWGKGGGVVRARWVEVLS